MTTHPDLKLHADLRAALAWRRMLGIQQNEFGWKGVIYRGDPKKIVVTYWRAYNIGDGTLGSMATARVTIDFDSGRVTIANDEMTASVPLWRINYNSDSIRSLLRALNIRPKKG